MQIHYSVKLCNYIMHDVKVIGVWWVGSHRKNSSYASLFKDGGWRGGVLSRKTSSLGTLVFHISSCRSYSCGGNCHIYQYAMNE